MSWMSKRNSTTPSAVEYQIMALVMPSRCNVQLTGGNRTKININSEYYLSRLKALSDLLGRQRKKSSYTNHTNISSRSRHTKKYVVTKPRSGRKYNRRRKYRNKPQYTWG